MSERSKHLFGFQATDIAKAANVEAAYHAARIEFWQSEYAKAVAILKQTARVEFREYGVTGGTRCDLVVNHGDPAAYQRMQEAWLKIESHRKAVEAFRTDAKVYASQGERLYELDAADVLYYRLGGGPREE